MIFLPGRIKPVLAGRLTQLRALRTAAPCLYRPGRSYAVQSRAGGPAIARVKIAEVIDQRLVDATERDIQAEGFANRDEWAADWADRFGAWHGSTLTQVVRFRLTADDPPRLMRPSRAATDYTDRPALAMPDEPEALSADELERIAAEVRRNEAGVLVAAGQALRASLDRWARAARIPKGDLRVIRKRIETAKRKSG